MGREGGRGGRSLGEQKEKRGKEGTDSHHIALYTAHPQKGSSNAYKCPLKLPFTLFHNISQDILTL